MTISEIKQLQTVDGWVDFQGQITKVGEIKSRVKSELSKTPGQQYNVQKLQIQDRTDVIGVWAYADKQFLPSQYVVVRGMLKEFNQQRYIDFATVKLAQQQPCNPSQASQQSQQGFQQGPPAQQPPFRPQQGLPPPQQAPQQQGQASLPNKPKDNNEYIIREAAAKAAVELVCNNKIDFDIRFEEAKNWEHYTLTGQDPTKLPRPDPEIMGATPEGSQDDIPF